MAQKGNTRPGRSTRIVPLPEPHNCGMCMILSMQITPYRGAGQVRNLYALNRRSRD